MSWLTGELHANGWTASRYPGFGILAEDAPSTGESGPALGYRPEWFGKQVRVEVVTQPIHGTLQPFEDTSFIYTGNGTADTAELQFFLDGIAQPATEPLTLNPAGEEQIHYTGGVCSVVRGVAAQTQSISNQVHTTAGLINLTRAAVLVSDFFSHQIAQTGGSVETTRGAVAVTQAVNIPVDEPQPNLQIHYTGGSAARHVSIEAVTAWVSDQIANTSGVVAVRRGAVAVTSWTDDSFVPDFVNRGISAAIIAPVYSASLIQ
ncbi:MAG: hypothetical protein CVV11_19770 [Gammaproteobacteria bacterium HGW-Gammaproteobacteria-15]|nr:MAG: hypothetical protein CVV11_19770 [Gammaproteobacteria bacterium HGW-Gammaproteobacteria-15]